MILRIAGMLLAASLFTSCTRPIEHSYPHTLNTIPTKFRGNWDEIINDGCAEREPRYRLSAKTLSEFEVGWHVLQVVRTSPVDIEVHTRIDPAFGDAEQEVWMFKLVEGGTALAAPDGQPPFYKRCPRVN